MSEALNSQPSLTNSSNFPSNSATLLMYVAAFIGKGDSETAKTLLRTLSN